MQMDESIGHRTTRYGIIECISVFALWRSEDRGYRFPVAPIGLVQEGVSLMEREREEVHTNSHSSILD